MATIRPGDHIGAAFASSGQFVTTVARFVEQGLAAGARVLVFPGGAHRDDPAGFRSRLAAVSPAVGAADERQVVVGDSRLVHLAGGGFDPQRLSRAYEQATRQAVADGYRGLWVGVDMTWAAEVGIEALVAFEAHAFPLFAAGTLTAVCLYDTRVFAPQDVTAACRAHPAGLTGGRPLRHEALPGMPGARLTGETDLANGVAFRTLVDSLRPGDTLDVTGMDFIDVRGLAEIAARLPELRVEARVTHERVLQLIRAAAGQPAVAG